MALLEVKNVHSYYGHIHALKDLSLTVDKGGDPDALTERKKYDLNTMRFDCRARALSNFGRNSPSSTA
jgi:hypothetical protein